MASSTAFNFRNLSHSDLQTASLASAKLHDIDSGEKFLQHCYSVMSSTLSHVHYSAEIYSMDPFTINDIENPTVSPYWINVFDQYKMQYPYINQIFSNQKSHLETIQQNPELSNFKKSDLYNEFYEKVEGRNLLWMAYRDGSELLSCICLRETEFTDNELAIQKILQPHFEIAWSHWKRTRSIKQELQFLKNATSRSPQEEANADVLRRGIDTLTSRQRDVVELLASGMDNQQIADELTISKFTVKKHLQAIFHSLEVSHRTELAAKWHQAHSVAIY